MWVYYVNLSLNSFPVPGKEVKCLSETKCCNYCGKELDIFDEQEDFVIHKNIGYGSTHDGDIIRLQFCCDCLDKIIDACAIDPKTGEYD